MLKTPKTYFSNSPWSEIEMDSSGMFFVINKVLGFPVLETRSWSKAIQRRNDLVWKYTHGIYS